MNHQDCVLKNIALLIACLMFLLPFAVGQEECTKVEQVFENVIEIGHDITGQEDEHWQEVVVQIVFALDENGNSPNDLIEQLEFACSSDYTGEFPNIPNSVGAQPTHIIDINIGTPDGIDEVTFGVITDVRLSKPNQDDIESGRYTLNLVTQHFEPSLWLSINEGTFQKMESVIRKDDQAFNLHATSSNQTVDSIAGDAVQTTMPYLNFDELLAFVPSGGEIPLRIAANGH